MIPIELVLSRLPDVRQTGPNQWIARCPAHDDRHPSLSISCCEDGRVLMFCHAGCTNEEICRALGIEQRDQFPQESNVTGSPKGRITAIYDYRDASGELLYQVVRFDPKDFRQRRPDGKGGWIWNIKGVQPVLYRLPELIEADKTEPVFIVEGEKDADSLAEIGIVATCNPGGAGKWSKVDSSPLYGRRVVILPDKDEPGRKHAAEVARSLYGKAAEVRIVELPGDGKDVSDWIEGLDCRTAEELRNALIEMAESTPPYVPPIEPEDGAPVLVRLADVKSEPLHWLWPLRIPIGKVTLIAGDPGLGKSLLTLDVAGRVSAGTPWPDCPDSPVQAGSVVLLSAEDDIADTIRPRLSAAGADVNRIVAIQGVFYKESDTGTIREAAFSLQDDLPALQKAITETENVRLVIIDPITAYLGRIDSHKNAEIRGLLAPLARLAAEHEVAILVITHLNKNASGSAMYRLTGSLGFVAAARAVWLVVKDSENPGRRLFLPVKNNLAPSGTGLAFTVQPSPNNPDIPVIAWEADPVEIHPDDALMAELGGNGSHSALQEAVDWLRDILGRGPVRAKEVKERAVEEGIALRTLDRAKAVLQVKARHEGFGGPWVWDLPHSAPKLP